MRAPAAGEAVYFVEHDGRVFLVHDKGTARLPARGEVPFPVEEKHRAQVLGRPVVFAAPVDKRQRDEWAWKDDLTHLGGAEPVARAAANMSQPRVVAKGVFRRGDEVVVLKDKVGFYRGRWSLPGGYLDYGESPEQCVLRELHEEVGLRGEVQRLLRVDSQVVPSGFQFITFHFLGEARNGAFALKEDEVEEARFVPLEQALREVASAHSRAALQMLAEAPR